MIMKRHYNILIIDRNPHVRELLKREIASEYYDVLLAKSGSEVMDHLSASSPLDLIIIDPDIADLRESDFHKILCKSPFPLPVIIHTFSPEDLKNSVIENI